MNAKRSLLNAIASLILLMIAGISTTGVGLASLAQTGSYHLGPEFQLSPTGKSVRGNTAIAYNPAHNEYLVVWQNEWPGGEKDIYARRVSDTGQVLSLFAVASGFGPGGDGGHRYQPDVAYNATNDEYLVVYQFEFPHIVETRIWGRVIPWNGPGTKPEKQIIHWANRSFDHPKVAWNSGRNEYLVAWNARDTATNEANDVAGYRVSANGDVQTPGIPIIIDTEKSPGDVDLVYNPDHDEYFVTWSVTNPATDSDVYGARLSWNGNRVDPPGTIPICTATNDQSKGVVASDGHDRYMVVWQEKISRYDYDIYARDYHADGSPDGPIFGIENTPEIQSLGPASVTAGGENGEWLVAWTHLDGDSPNGLNVRGYHRTSNPIAGATYVEITHSDSLAYAEPVVAADIPGFLVAYVGLTTPEVHDIYGRLYWPQAIYLPMIWR